MWTIFLKLPYFNSNSGIPDESVINLYTSICQNWLQSWNLLKIGRVKMEFLE
jgi:hypothetical protein